MSETTACMFNAIQTEHAKIVVIIGEGPHQFYFKKSVSSDNVDIFSYINSKITTTEKHIRTQLISLHRTLLHEQCKNERMILQTQLSIAKIDPQEFAFLRHQEPGYTAVVLGEMIHIVKCQPVEVTLNNNVSSCYQELPVLYDNKPCFMTPKNHLIQQVGTPIQCGSLITSGYMMLGNWYTMNPKLTRIQQPEELHPENKLDWVYIDIKNLATSGLYSSKMLDEVRHQLMFPSEREAVSSTIAMSAMSYSHDTQGLHLGDFIPQNAIETAINKYMNYMWKIFFTIGHVSSTFLGMYLCWRVLKFTIDTVIHGYHLHTLFGWSWKIIAMFWDSITYCLIHLQTKKEMHEKLHTQNITLNDVDPEKADSCNQTTNLLRFSQNASAPETSFTPLVYPHWSKSFNDREMTSQVIKLDIPNDTVHITNVCDNKTCPVNPKRKINKHDV